MGRYRDNKALIAITHIQNASNSDENVILQEPL